MSRYDSGREIAKRAQRGFIERDPLIWVTLWVNLGVSAAAEGADFSESAEANSERSS